MTAHWRGMGEDSAASTTGDPTEATLRRLKANYPPRPPAPQSARRPFLTRRVVAGVIDLFVIMGFFAALVDWVLVPMAIDRFAPAPPPGLPLRMTASFTEYEFNRYGGVAQLLAFLALMAVTEVLFGRSPGKWLTGLEILERDGRALNMPRRALRHVVRWLPLYISLAINAIQAAETVGLISPLPVWWLALAIPAALVALAIQAGWLGVFANDGQTLHDVIVRTRVIDPNSTVPDEPFEATGHGFDVLPTPASQS